MRLSLRARIFLILMVPLVLVAAAAGALRHVQADRMVAQLYDNTLLTVAYTISRDVIGSEGDLLTEALLDKLTRALGDPVYYRVSAPGGGFVTGYSSTPALPPGAEVPGGVPVFYDSVADGRPVRVVVLREFISDPQFDGWTTVTVWQTVRQREAMARRFGQESAVLLTSVVAAAGLLLWFGIQVGLKPLHDVRDAIGRRSADDLQPIRRWVPPELTSIVATANSLFARLSAGFALRDSFIADAAHQIRNPVAALQSQAEAALLAPASTDVRPRVAEMTATVRQLGRLTNQLLSMERIKEGALRADFRPVDLDRLARQQTTRLAEVLLPRGVTVSFDRAGQPAPVLGDPVMLDEMIQNLLDNAVKYGIADDGSLSVRLDYGPAQVAMIIADSGPGIPPEVRERVFDRFFRVSDAGPDGSGLGLAIVRDVAEAHGGQAVVRDVPAGCRIDVILPLVGPVER
ncbi:sensor histidine kinase [Paracoccus luteus]|uniref:sensor histidine kinase n=1 Tax=Paracoccus luteus TaxID=2508543 RepID=UPI001FE7FB12|nr:sensor histidine kinase [Paracoccus luteus]